MASKFGSSPKCPTCEKSVFAAEQIMALGKPYHKICLKCSACGKKVEPGNFSDKDDKIFCKVCYNQNYGPKGYGFGNSIDSHTRGQGQ